VLWSPRICPSEPGMWTIRPEGGVRRRLTWLRWRSAPPSGLLPEGVSGRGCLLQKGVEMMALVGPTCEP
jgi:hypothetical protein